MGRKPTGLGVYGTDMMHYTNNRVPRLRMFHLVLFLICLLNEGSSDLVQLPECRNHPDCLRAALLGGLWEDVKLWLRDLH